MHFRAFRITLVLLLAMGVSSVKRAAADPLLYVLTGVQFDDGAVATGSFVFDPTTETYISFDITTTAGLIGNMYSGSHYLDGSGTDPRFIPAAGDVYGFDNGSIDHHFVTFSTLDGIHVTGPGIYSITLGSPNDPPSSGFGGSGEFVDAAGNYRLLTTGTFVVSEIPEARTIGLSIVGLLFMMFVSRRTTRKILLSDRN